MKTEILVAIGVLASGVAVTHQLTRNTSPANVPENFAQSAPAQLNQYVVARKPPQDDSSWVASNASLARPDFDANQNDLIVKAARSLANSPPLQARLRYKINLFDEQISGPGRYFQKGQGSRKTRIEFDFGFDESAVQLHQFCDGHKLYTLSIAGDQSNLEFVDLRKLDSLQQNMSSSSRVASWLSVGSLTGLMEQLASHFIFTEVEESMLDSIPVVECTGRWNPLALERLLEGQAEGAAVEDGLVRWQQLPVHLPHQVRLTLGTDQRFPYFPYRIVFDQFSLVDGQQVRNEVAVLELYELKHATGLTDEMFNVPGVDTPPIDSTEFYRQRILQFTR